MDLGYYIGLMVESMKVIGKMVNRKEMESIQIEKVKLLKQFGNKENDNNHIKNNQNKIFNLIILKF